MLNFHKVFYEADSVFPSSFCNQFSLSLPEPSGALMPCTLGLKMYELKNHASAIYGGRVAKNSKKTAIIEIEELEIVAIDDVLVKISETDTSVK